MKAVFTIEQIDDKLVITIEQAEPITKEQDGIDWSRQPFPRGYYIPKGIKVITLIKESMGGVVIKAGSIGTTLETHDCPDIDFGNGRIGWGGTEYVHFASHELAPINPTDHPLHPDFKCKN